MRPMMLATLLVLAVDPAPAAEVLGLRLWAGPDKTRVVLDLDRGVDYRLFTLQDPERLVVDIDQARLQGGLGPLGDTDGLVAAIRHGIRDRHHLRVVIDLSQPVRPQSFLLEPAGHYGHRLVIDLHPRDAIAAPKITAAKPVPATEPSLRDMIVAIDAGHGGEDPGAIGPGRTYEKTVTLAIARELERQVNQTPGMQAVMIRTGDYYIPLKDRYGRARRMNADLFVSIHADAFRDFRVRGSSVYVLSRRGASSEAARLLAQSENEADLVGGVRIDQQTDDVLKSVLLDLSQSAALEYSGLAAESILGQLGTVGKTHKPRVERANFVVLRSPDVPSVLIEVGFISNPDDEKNLNSVTHRQRLAAAITEGIVNHFSQTAPQDTWFAANRRPSRYIVRRGDSLGAIAQRHQVSVNQIRRANQLSGDVIHPGAVLLIPSG